MNRYKVYMHVDYYIEIEANSEKEARAEALCIDPHEWDVLKTTIKVELDPTFKPITKEVVASMTPQEAWEKFVGSSDIGDFVKEVRSWHSTAWDHVRWISQGCFDNMDDIENLSLKYAYQIVWLKDYDHDIAPVLAHKLKEYILQELGGPSAGTSDANDDENYW